MAHDWKVIFRNLTTPGNPPDQSFVDWSPGFSGYSKAKSIVLSRFRDADENRQMSDRQCAEAFAKRINEVMGSEKTGIKIIFDETLIVPDFTFVIDGLKNSSLTNPLVGIFVTEDANVPELVLKDLYLLNLGIDVNNCLQAISIERCSIKRITTQVARNEIPQPSIFYIIDSRIDTFHAKKNTISQLIMSGGCLLRPITPPPGSGNPFVGDVEFSNVFFPRAVEYFHLPGAQQYRSLRHHLRELHNEHTGNIIHAAELAVERDEDAKRSNRILSRLYEMFSDFGNSAVRPLGWIVFSLVLSVTLIMCVDGAVALPQVDGYHGWQTGLSEDGFVGKATKALVLTGQHFLNPLGVLGVKGLTVASNGWVAFGLMVYSLFNIVFISLMIFAMRRRFKIQQ